MPLVIVSGVTKHYGVELVLEDASLTIHERDRIGLIGANGAGKTTLCKLILREEQPDEGTITTARGATLGYLPQDPAFTAGQTPWELAMSVFPEMREMEERLRAYEEQMSGPATEDLDAVLEQYGRAREEYEGAGGYEYETRAATFLTGVGLPESDFRRPLESLSGGEKSRAALAALLLQEPDLLLLDEPTNHLDIQGTEWLEGRLRGYRGAVVVISHDRRFLNQAVRRIVEVACHQLTEYTGDYDDYVRQKEDRLVHYERVYEKQQRERERQLAFIRWALGTGQEKRVRAAKSRMKLLEKVEWLDLPAGQSRKVNLRFTPRIRGGDDVAELSGVTVGYGDDALVRDVNLFVSRGDRVGIVGPNGCGKTTLLKALLNQIEPLEGIARLGASVEVGYFAQERPEPDPGRTVMEDFAEVVTGATPGELRHLLARFLFVEDDVFKLLGQLSGGEHSRLALAKLIMERPTFLVLDEPTNHLDIDSRGALENALNEYTGTLLVVSHDRYFLDAVVGKVLVIEDSVAKLYPGNYSAYRDAVRREEEARLAAEAASREAERAARRREQKLARREKKRLREAHRKTPRADGGDREQLVEDLEARAQELEARIARIEALLGDPEVCADGRRVEALSVEYDRLEGELQETYAAWEDAAGYG